MHVVAIHKWQEETPELVQALAASLGILAYEMRQRMIGGGPAVVACFADQQQARALAVKLNLSGVATLIIDTDALRRAAGRFVVRRFELNEQSLYIEASGGERTEISYGDIDLLLCGTRVHGQPETVTVTERKFSLGKTILSGGIPLTKKVERQEEVTKEERENILYLYAGERPPVVFSQGGISYEGFGAAMKLTRELNFTFLKSELRRLCQAAGFDDRLSNRLGQVRLLGPTLNPETNLDLAFEILARSLRRPQSTPDFF
jgi:hypothetical protein